MTDQQNKARPAQEQDQAPSQSDALPELLRHVQARENAPEQTKQRIKHQLKVHWQEKNKQRHKVKPWLMFGSMATAMSLIIGIVFTQITMTTNVMLTAVYLENVQGVVKTSGLNNTNQELASGAMVETFADGYATLTLQTGGNLRLNHNSQLIINENNEFTLSYGTVYFDSGFKQGKKMPITLHTIHGNIQDIGTQFEVSSNRDEIQISVREGQIDLDSGDSVKSLHAGYQLVSDKEGRFKQLEISPTSANWQWVNNAAPKFMLEGKDLHQFLTWISREHGLTLVFKNNHIEKLSKVVTLHGDINNLTLKQALATVFSTTELKYMLTQDKLEVYR